MAKKQVRQMAAELYQKLSDRRFLQQTGITKKHIQSLFVKEEWERWFDRLLPIKERVTCREIFERCEKVMNRLSPEPEEGWMKFTYQLHAASCIRTMRSPQWTAAIRRDACSTWR